MPSQKTPIRHATKHAARTLLPSQPHPIRYALNREERVGGFEDLANNDAAHRNVFLEAVGCDRTTYTRDAAALIDAFHFARFRRSGYRLITASVAMEFMLRSTEVAHSVTCDHLRIPPATMYFEASELRTRNLVVYRGDSLVMLEGGYLAGGAMARISDAFLRKQARALGINPNERVQYVDILLTTAPASKKDYLLNIPLTLLWQDGSEPLAELVHKTANWLNEHDPLFRVGEELAKPHDVTFDIEAILHILKLFILTSAGYTHKVVPGDQAVLKGQRSAMNRPWDTLLVGPDKGLEDLAPPLPKTSGTYDLTIGALRAITSETGRAEVVWEEPFVAKE